MTEPITPTPTPPTASGPPDGARSLGPGQVRLRLLAATAALAAGGTAVVVAIDLVRTALGGWLTNGGRRLRGG